MTGLTSSGTEAGFNISVNNFCGKMPAFELTLSDDNKYDRTLFMGNIPIITHKSPFKRGCVNFSGTKLSGYADFINHLYTNRLTITPNTASTHALVLNNTGMPEPAVIGKSTLKSYTDGDVDSQKESSTNL